MESLTKVKNIIFDLGGVILNIDYLLTIKGFEELGVETFEAVFSQQKQSKFTDAFETGEISEIQFYEKLKEVTGVEFSFESYREAWNAMLLDLPEERLKLLRELSGKFRLFLLSNTNETHYKEFITKVEQDFDSIFEKVYYSHFFGKRKPNKDSFLSILEENELMVEETLFIDDSIQHIESAREIGMKSIYLKGKDILEELKGIE